MLPINLIYDFQLLERGVHVYCNNQIVGKIEPIKRDNYFNGYYKVYTVQEDVYCHPDKTLSLSAIKNIVPNNARWS